MRWVAGFKVAGLEFASKRPSWARDEVVIDDRVVWQTIGWMAACG